LFQRGLKYLRWDLQILLTCAEAVENGTLVGCIGIQENTIVVNLLCRLAILSCGDVRERDFTKELGTFIPWHCSIACVGGNVIHVGKIKEPEVVRTLVWLPVDVPDTEGATKEEGDVVAGLGTTVLIEVIVVVEDGAIEVGFTRDAGGASSRVIPKKSMGDS
jgi:hypothetical protein